MSDPIQRTEVVDETDELEELRSADARTRAKRASELMARYQDLANECSRLRKEAVADLVSSGWTHREVGELLGMSRARVGQLVASGPPVERALLGAGKLTVAVAGKAEAPKKTRPASTMVSEEASRAYELIAETATSYGLGITREVVPPPGLVDLNRQNLVVIGSPRLLPLVGQMLASDQHLGFEQDSEWFLVDKTAGVEYRADDDRGEDFAYLGRVPRPDGRGSFLYLAGIHAPGTLGAATYLTGHMDELYREVKSRRFSLLVHCRYDPKVKPRVIESARPATPIYTT